MKNTYVVKHLMQNGQKGKTYIMANSRDEAFELFRARFGWWHPVFGIDMYIDNSKK